MARMGWKFDLGCCVAMLFGAVVLFDLDNPLCLFLTFSAVVAFQAAREKYRIYRGR